jgi:N-acetylmuramoyl-L-alanine amidase
VVKVPTWLAYVALIAGSAYAHGEPRRLEPPPLPPAPAPRAAAPIVMLDPGHGGSNLGARSAGAHAGARTAGLTEKRLTLALASRVADRLRARGVDVRLTRTDDRTLTLRRRVELANRAPADLFVSIHANASASHARRGFETYVLTAEGVDVDGRALRGDAATPRPGVDPEIALVLDDVERGAAQWGAADLAARMQRALRDRRGAAGDRGVRQDAHHVLLGATMPAVLVEVGFLDHPLEGKELADSRVQDQLADAIAEAILDQLAD